MTVSSHITKEAEKLRENLRGRVKSIIASDGGCMTLDGWTEEYTRTKYIGCTFHYVQDYNLKEELLFITEFPHTKRETGN